MELQHKKVVIAGGSGLLGISMATQFCDAGAEVTVLSRSKPKANGPWRTENRDGRTLGDWLATIDGFDAVVNLAGRTVNCIKTPERSSMIR